MFLTIELLFQAQGKFISELKSFPIPFAKILAPEYSASHIYIALQFN